ncbi:hypothetical protein HBH47_244470 [Parastagonospora nodorum]|nr:hypothetical protein HBH47_244470 [Parastagonospora nodorum]
MPIKNNNNLLNTINSHIKLRKLKEKYLKVCKADALKQVDANVREEENKNYSSLYYSNKLEAQLRKASKEEELAKTKKEKREKKLTTIYSANKQTRIRDSLSARNKRIIKLLARAYILYFKELLSNNSRIFASKNEIVTIDPINSILCNLSNLLIIRFCIFSNSALENIGILINKKIIAEANMPTMHSKAIKHYLALLAA